MIMETPGSQVVTPQSQKEIERKRRRREENESQKVYYMTATKRGKP